MKERYDTDPEFRAASRRRSDEWREENKERYKDNQKSHYKRTLDRRRVYVKIKREADPDKAKAEQRERSKRYREKHGDKANARSAAWEKANPDRRMVKGQRRRARKVSKPDTFTPEQWRHCLDYFKGCCAVCGRPLGGLFHRPHADHWIALSDPDSPGTVARNMVCLCGGRGGCNESKANKRPEVWLESKFGKRKAKQIIKRVEGYFASLSDD
jgi:hypothetical protein